MIFSLDYIRFQFVLLLLWIILLVFLCFRCDGNDVKGSLTNRHAQRSIKNRRLTTNHSQHFPLFANPIQVILCTHSQTHTFKSAVCIHITLRRNNVPYTHKELSVGELARALKQPAVYAHRNFPLNKYTVIANPYFPSSRDPNRKLLILWAHTHINMHMLECQFPPTLTLLTVCILAQCFIQHRFYSYAMNVEWTNVASVLIKPKWTFCFDIYCVY